VRKPAASLQRSWVKRSVAFEANTQVINEGIAELVTMTECGLICPMAYITLYSSIVLSPDFYVCLISGAETAGDEGYMCNIALCQLYFLKMAAMQYENVLLFLADVTFVVSDSCSCCSSFPMQLIYVQIVLLDECRVAYSCRCRRHTVYDLCRMQPGEITLEY